MAISKNQADNEKYKFKESTSVPGQPGVTVVNPDGSNVFSQTEVATVSGGDSLDLVLDGYLASLETPLSLQLAYQDDFSHGFQGWQYQYDTTGRTGITLTEEARMGNYALEIHSRATASDQAWCRKGLSIPTGVKKVIYGTYFTMHAQNANNPASIVFDMDMQFGSGTQRYYFAARYFNHNGTALQNKWQVNTGTATSQSFTDVTSGAMGIPWNESIKPMLNYMIVVLDVQSFKYEKLYSNGNVYNVNSQNIGPTASTSLSNFDGGAVNIYRIENRSNSTEEGIMTLEKPFLIWGF